VSVGPLEIVIVLVLALLVFGPKRLPQAGRSLGHAMREFRKATQTARTELGLDEVAEGVNDLKSSLSIDLNSAAAPSPRQAAAAAAAAAVVAPAADQPVADKPLPVATAGSDTTPVEVTAAEAAAEPAVDEPVAAEAAGDGDTAAGASAGRDDA
jgi:sec-independent protein translocase protein TatA